MFWSCNEERYTAVMWKLVTWSRWQLFMWSPLKMTTMMSLSIDNKRSQDSKTRRIKDTWSQRSWRIGLWFKLTWSMVSLFSRWHLTSLFFHSWLLHVCTLFSELFFKWNWWNMFQSSSICSVIYSLQSNPCQDLWVFFISLSLSLISITFFMTHPELFGVAYSLIHPI